MNLKIEEAVVIEELPETWGEGLEGQALDIVSNDADRLCVQAGPGTGKSYCMTRRVLRLIQQKKVQPSEVLAVTFTRTAANDLRNELSAVLGETYSGFRSQTLHSICNEILKTQGFLDSQNRVARSLLTTSKSSNLGFEAAPMLQDLKAVNEAFGTATKQSKTIKAYEAAWARRQEDPLAPPAQDGEAGYEANLLAWMSFHRCMLVGELVPLAWRYLHSDPTTIWATRFKAVLVDEYQDLNKVDQEVIELLAGTSLQTVVGDLDQSIYSFRHAHPAGLTEYSARGGVQNVSMEWSRRCPTSHISVSQAHIKKNTNHAPEYSKPLPDAISGKIFNRVWTTDAEMISGAVEYVKFVHGQGISYGKILLMTPARPFGQAVRDALKAADIEAQSYFTEEALEEVEAQRAFTVLSLAANRKDRVALRCWLGDWKSHQNSTQYIPFRIYCEAHNLEPWDALEIIASDGVPEGLTVGRLLERFAALKEALVACEPLAGQELLDHLFPETASWAQDMRVAAGESLAVDLDSKTLHEQLMSEIVHPNIPDDVDHVRIMSLHKSKGLTSDASAIIGCMEGLLPRHYNPAKTDLSENEYLEEQRRLFYVALTRSKNFLLLASFTRVDSSFANTYQIPGVYLRRERCLIAQVSSFVSGLGALTPQASISQVFP